MKKIEKAITVALAAALLSGCLFSPEAAVRQFDKKVRLGGQPFGVKFYSDGVMVIELESFYSNGRYVCPAKDGDLREGDVITKVNGAEIKTNEELQQATFGCGGEPVTFTVKRDGKELVKTVTPKLNTAGVYLLGAWVRDSCAGIGTVTYYDPENDVFAALGHGICDKDTAGLLPLSSAEIVSAHISSVSKSSPGKAGSLNGYFDDKTLGNLTRNTPCGVYGTTNDKNLQSGTELRVAENGEIKVGKAQLYTTAKGDECCCYEAEITKIRNTDAQSNENFVIKVTDERLIGKCGGIVQGMSGSPVVQDGKLVGAVTHVFLDHPQEGYGITAQNMVSNYKN